MKKTIRRISVGGVEYPIESESVIDGAITSEKLSQELRDEISGYHDDGSGNLVPVKHPDLSTQPSILPYKVGGSYVYEQLICLLDGNLSEDSDFPTLISGSIPWAPEVQNPRILSASFFTDTNPSASTPVTVIAHNTRIEVFIWRIPLIASGSLPLSDGTMPNGWLRIEYTDFKDAGSNYYYSYQGEEKLGELHIVYDTENYDSSLVLALYEGRANDGIPLYGDIISRCDVEVPKGVRLNGDYLRKFLYEDLKLMLSADSPIYGICKGTTCVSGTTPFLFAYDTRYGEPFVNLIDLDIKYSLTHGETVVLRLNSSYS